MQKIIDAIRFALYLMTHSKEDCSQFRDKMQAIYIIKEYKKDWASSPEEIAYIQGIIQLLYFHIYDDIFWTIVDQYNNKITQWC